ncbi:MAG: prenyltransferase/squalene oxidase repeat-containing protein [Planctomycetota bacterium]
MNDLRNRARRWFLCTAIGALPWLCATASAQEPVRRPATDDHLVDAELMSAVERGLAYLQQSQSREGSWDQLVGYKLNSDYETVDNRPQPHVGVTALACISFLAGGHLPDRGKYGETITKGLDHVLSCAQDDGQITENGTRMYSHAFATLFLAEIYGMSNNPRVKNVLQRSVNLIVDSQNSEGGWRYRPFARESDMSITVCQVLALRSARNVGIHVPATTIRNAQNYVYRSAVRSNERGNRRPYRAHGGYGDDGGSFRYQLKPQTRATFPLTAAGVTTLYAAGEYESPIIKDALDFLDRDLFTFNDQNDHGHYFFYYGHYYAVQAYYITGGSQWRRYFTEVKGRLLRMQRADGSWPNDVGPGPSFGTAVATLILQIPLQYLPIFQR